jgi:hypothetical protein
MWLGKISHTISSTVKPMYIFCEHFFGLISDRGSMSDHNFLQFSTIFGEQNWRFSQKSML